MEYLLGFIFFCPKTLPHVQNICIQLELMDEREKGYLLVLPRDWWGDLKIVCGRIVDLNEAPYTWEAQRFPKIEYSLLEFNRALRQTFFDRQFFYPVHEEHYRKAINYLDTSHELWHALYQTQMVNYFAHTRRALLKDLKSKLGDDAFYKGQMPPVCPLEYLIELR